MVVFLVYMRERKQARLILFQQWLEAHKALMRKILHVAVSAHGGVGHHDIKPAVLPNGGFQLPDAFFHFVLGIHARPRFISHAAAQPEDPDTVDDKKLSVCVQAAFRLQLFVGNIMVTRDIYNRSGCKARQKREIPCGEIAAGQDQLHTFQLSLIQMLPEHRIRFIGNQQDFHGHLFSFLSECQFFTVS